MIKTLCCNKVVVEVCDLTWSLSLGESCGSSGAHWSGRTSADWTSYHETTAWTDRWSCQSNQLQYKQHRIRIQSHRIQAEALKPSVGQHSTTKLALFMSVNSNTKAAGMSEWFIKGTVHPK